MLSGGLLLHGAESDPGHEKEWLPLVMEIDGEDALRALEDEGALIWRRRGDLALVLYPRAGEGTEDAVRRVRRIRGIGRVERGRRVTPAMDVARTLFGADRVGSGEEFGIPYTGRGVVTGFCDVGFDPLHINFLDEEGNTRVKRFVVYDELHAGRSQYDGPEEVALAGTDNSSIYHATHVAGIMAGSYTGLPYTGMAPQADIVATVSSLYDVGILAGLEDIIEYAASVGKRAVVNMSLSDQLGPRDGKSLQSRWLSMAGEDAVIVISAGNAGETLSHLRFIPQPGKENVRVRLHSGDWMQFSMHGGVSVWGDDDSPLRFRLHVFDEIEGKEVLTFPWISSADDGYMLIDSAQDAEFGRYFTGRVELAGEVSEENGRTRILVVADADTEEKNPKGNWARYNLGLEVEGEPGSGMELFSDANGVRIVRWPGYPATDSEMSINDMVTAGNVVSVGMYVSRKEVPLLGGRTVTYIDPMQVSPKSSYGYSPDGTTLPLTVAPGHGIVSSYSRYYISANPGEEDVCAAVCEVDGECYYWGPCVGTSMSAPYTAGCIAQWLEANPRLRTSDIIDIIRRTNRRDVADSDNPRHGEGWLDPVAGMREALAMSATGELAVGTGGSAPRLQYSGGSLYLWQGDHSQGEIIVTDLTGREVLRATARPGEEVPVSRLGGGVYIARAAGAEALKFIVE